jgi:hypothetical protein
LDGCWVGVGCWVAVGCWVLQGGDNEVSRRDTLQGVSRRGSGASLASASRSVGAHFLGVGCWVLGVGCWMAVGCWVRGRVAPGGSSRRRGHFAGMSMAGLKAPVGGITAAWSSPLWAPCRSCNRRALGVGCWVLGGLWVLGVGCWVGFGCWVLQGGDEVTLPGLR